MDPKEENQENTKDSEAGSLPPDRLSSISTYLPFGAAHQESNEARPSSRLRSVRNSVISVGLIDEKSFTRECITNSLQALDNRLDIVAFPTCKEYLDNMEGRDLVVYHYYNDSSVSHGNTYEILTLKKILHLVPVIILSDVGYTDSLVDMLESGARGLISTYNTTVAQIIGIIGFIVLDGMVVAPSSLFLRRNNANPVTAKPRSMDQFTPSELVVLDRLKLGKANKIIAYELGLSESTVKSHIGKIMKKLRVTNRTQIVLQLNACTSILLFYYNP
jgi:DNA-binding NarL/FixJ family response regulator